jgi:hypothetical protein
VAVNWTNQLHESYASERGAVRCIVFHEKLFKLKTKYCGEAGSRFHADSKPGPGLDPKFVAKNWNVAIWLPKSSRFARCTAIVPQDHHVLEVVSSNSSAGKAHRNAHSATGSKATPPVYAPLPSPRASWPGRCFPPPMLNRTVAAHWPERRAQGCTGQH